MIPARLHAVRLLLALPVGLTCSSAYAELEWTRTCVVKDGVVALTSEGGAVWRVNGETRAEARLPLPGIQAGDYHFGENLTRAACVEVPDAVFILYATELEDSDGLHAALLTPAGLKWTLEVGGSATGWPLVTDSSVFLVAGRDVTKVDLASGRVVWKRRNPGKARFVDSTCGTPRLEGSRLLVPVNAHQDGERVREVVLDAKSGKTLSSR